MTARELQNRFGGADRLVDRYVAGAKPTEFNAAERQQLREALMRADAYRNPRHPHHERLSMDVADLFAADPGAQFKDAGLGTVAAPSPEAAQTQGQSLFRS